MVTFAIIALIGCVGFFLLTKYWDSQSSDENSKDNSNSNGGCSNILGLIFILCIIIGLIAIGLHDCSHSTGHEYDELIENPRKF